MSARMEGDIGRPPLRHSSGSSAGPNTRSRRSQPPEARARNSLRPSSLTSSIPEQLSRRSSDETVTSGVGPHNASFIRAQSPLHSGSSIEQSTSSGYRTTGERPGQSHEGRLVFNAPNDDDEDGDADADEDEPTPYQDNEAPVEDSQELSSPPMSKGRRHDGNVKVHRKLNTWDATALIMNKMIGGGIFTTPGQILLLTGNKGIALAFWAVGGIYSMISFSLYLEYGLNFPFNGGDLIYLDETWPFPELLATTLYSGFFITLGHNAGNTIVFAKYCIAAAMGDNLALVSEPVGTIGKVTADATDFIDIMDFDKRVINVIAVFVLSVVCLLLWVSDRTGLALNRLLAYYKFGLLITVFIAGAIAVNNENSGKDDWAEFRSPDNDASANFSRLSAMIYVVYAYQGWENANYVTGELKLAAGELNYPKRVLQRGGFFAVGATTILYVMAVAGYYMACDFDTIIRGNSDMGMGQYFASQVFGGHTTGFKVCIALSALGNLIAVVYSNSKVKQCIARQRIFPFSDWFAKDDSFNTPGPALLLHWIFNVPFILAMPNDSDGYSFIIGIYSYTHLIVLIFVGLGILRLGMRMRAHGRQNNEAVSAPHGNNFELQNHNSIVPDDSNIDNASQDEPRKPWKWKFLMSQKLRWAMVVVFVGVNVLVIAVSAKPPQDGRNGKVPRYFWAVVSAAVLAGSFVYWLFLRMLMTDPGQKLFGIEMSLMYGTEARAKQKEKAREQRNRQWKKMGVRLDNGTGDQSEGRLGWKDSSEDQYLRRDLDNRYVSWRWIWGGYESIRVGMKHSAERMRSLLSSDVW